MLLLFVLYSHAPVNSSNKKSCQIYSKPSIFIKKLHVSYMRNNTYPIRTYTYPITSRKVFILHRKCLTILFVPLLLKARESRITSIASQIFVYGLGMYHLKFFFGLDFEDCLFPIHIS